MTIRQAIESINATFVTAINRGDAATIAMLYAEDCSVLVPNHATLCRFPVLVSASASLIWCASWIKSGKLHSAAVSFTAERPNGNVDLR